MVGFTDRLDAGVQLASALSKHRGTGAHILGLARGGVVVGFAVGEKLQLPMHALVVRKLGAPHNPELAVGAVSETGVRWVDPILALATGATESYLQREVIQQVKESKRRQQQYSIGLGSDAIRGRTTIVVDDGIATGASALVGVRSARDLGASHVVLATPVASEQAEQLLKPEVDEMIVLVTPDPFLAVGLYYESFNQVSDAEVIDYLMRARQPE